MALNTKKNLNIFAEKYFTVFHINSNGSRGLQYGNLRGLKLIEVLMNAVKKGIRVVIVEQDKAFTILREIYGCAVVDNNSQRDPQFYEKMLPYSYDFKEFDTELASTNKPTKA